MVFKLLRGSEHSVFKNLLGVSPLHHYGADCQWFVKAEPLQARHVIG
jgi:hypothetical protein